MTLAVVVGPGARIAGYAAVLDFARPDVPANQAYLARSFPTHTVISRWAVPRPASTAEPRLELVIDGRRRQHASTAGMIVSADGAGRHDRATLPAAPR